MNRYYFPRAALLEEPGELAGTPGIEYVVQGKVGAAVADDRLIDQGFFLVDQLDSALPGRTVYCVYRRDVEHATSRPPGKQPLRRRQ